MGCNSVNDREKDGKEGNEMKVSVDEAPHNVAWVVFEWFVNGRMVFRGD